MTPEACRAAIAALLLTVPGIAGGQGVVHEQRRIVRDEQAIKQLLCPPGLETVNAWMISFAPAGTTSSERHPGHHGKGVKGGGNVITTFRWQIEGYHAIDDAADSEQVFEDLAWAVADEFNAYGLLDVPGIVHQLPADVEQCGYSMFGNFALYHYARIGVGFQGRTRPA